MIFRKYNINNNHIIYNMSSPITRILSIDIGIKNLAFCLFEIENNEYKVKKWEIVNIGEETPLFCGEIENEKSKNKSTQLTICNKPAKYTKNGKCFCLKHSKKQIFQIPTKELESAYLNKQKINKLFELAEKYNIEYTKPIKKQDLIHLFNEYMLNKCFEVVNTANSNKVDIITIGKNIKLKFDIIFEYNSIPTPPNIDIVLIENQISPIANRMKTIQGMVAQYFIMKNSNQFIEFVSSFNKLKEVNKKNVNEENKLTDKAKYNERKKLGITTCLENLEKNNINDEWLKYFNKHSKKDDLADCFLQGLWYITNKL